MITDVTSNSVSILVVMEDGENWRRAYVNSEEGRKQILLDFPDAYEELCGEGKVWGTEPTVFPDPEPEFGEEKPSQLDLIEAQVTYTAMMTDTLLEV